MKTLLLIHGMFMTPDCWKEWIPYFQQRGYRVIAPAWPLHDRTTAQMNQAHPDSALGKLEYADLIASYDKVLDTLSEPPVVIGHSMGGLVAQTLLAQGRVAAAVAIQPAPPVGVRSLAWSHLKSNLPLVNPFSSAGKPRKLDLDAFSYVFVNGMTDSARRAAWTEFAVPESKMVARTSGDKRWAIDFSKAHAPLLFISGSEDHCIPASLVRKARNRYVDGGSGADLREFAGRNHFTIGAAGWEAVAGSVAGWIDSLPSKGAVSK
jgi:pimeloyl-ACP methyl ester carboxylesterase